MMSFKIPCGGFRLDEESFSLDENGVLSVSGGGSGGVTTLHIDISAVNEETMEATFTADKTPTAMQQAAINGPVWCVVTFAAGLMGEEAMSFGVPPTWRFGAPTFGTLVQIMHQEDGNNEIHDAVTSRLPDTWILDLGAFGS